MEKQKEEEAYRRDASGAKQKEAYRRDASGAKQKEARTYNRRERK